MSDLLDTIRLVVTAVGAIAAVWLTARAAGAWLDLWERLEQRRADAAQRERDRLDQLAAARRIPSADQLHDMHPDIPREEP